MKWRYYVIIFLFSIITLSSSACTQVDNDNVNNQFFFPSNVTEKRFKCESLIHGDFKGEATLKIIKIENTKLNSYYELILTDFNGKYNPYEELGGENFNDLQDLSLGYFYVDNDKIYTMSANEEFREIFAEVDEFPPTEDYIEQWNGKRKAAGLHDGYFSYRLILSQEPISDNFNIEDSDMYHESMNVSDNEITYTLFPKVGGTKEYMYIYWEKEKGITYYANWVGSLRDYIAFFDDAHADKSMLKEQ